MVSCQMFERETRREKILDARHRELRLKERTRTTDKVNMSDMNIMITVIIMCYVGFSNVILSKVHMTDWLDVAHDYYAVHSTSGHNQILSISPKCVANPSSSSDFYDF